MHTIMHPLHTVISAINDLAFIHSFKAEAALHPGWTSTRFSPYQISGAKDAAGPASHVAVAHPDVATAAALSVADADSAAAATAKAET